MENDVKVKQAAIDIAKAVYECIVAAGPQGVPSGHLYAACMGGGMTLDAYEGCIRLLERAGLIRNERHLLTAMERL